MSTLDKPLIKLYKMHLMIYSVMVLSLLPDGFAYLIWFDLVAL